MRRVPRRGMPYEEEDTCIPLAQYTLSAVYNTCYIYSYLFYR